MDLQAVLSDSITALAGTASMSEVQAVMRRAPRRLLAADGATFVLREGDQCFYADEDAASPLWKGQRFPLTQCISGWAMLHAETAVVPDIWVDDRIPMDAYRPTFVRSLVMVPIGRPPIAALGTYWDEARTPSEVEIEALERLAAAAADTMVWVELGVAPDDRRRRANAERHLNPERALPAASA